MARRFIRQALVVALVAQAGAALAQKAGAESPAVSGSALGALGLDGSAAIGTGLRLFPTASGAAIVPQPVTPAPAAAIAPTAKPAPAAARQPVAAPGKPAPLVPQASQVRPAASPTSFRTDAAISSRVRQQVLAAALPSSPNPAGLRQAVESGAPWQEFDRLLVQHGYDPRDLADVVAAFYLITWEVATGQDATDQPAGIAAVRGQARGLLVSNAALSGLSEAERQSTAETLAFHAMAVAARAHDLHAAGNAQALAAFRAEVADTVARQQGVDLRNFNLTPAGFQAR